MRLILHVCVRCGGGNGNGITANAFRKFAEVRFLLYICPEIGTYAGDVDTFPARTPTIADRLSGRVGGRGRSARRPESDASSRAQAAGAPQPIAAGAHLARDARHRDVGRAPVSVVPRATGRQFVVRSTAAPAVGDLCRADAARVAAARHARQHRDAFWRGWRVVALDGTQFSLINTPAYHATPSRRR